jgi:hypothetical protein
LNRDAQEPGRNHRLDYEGWLAPNPKLLRCAACKGLKLAVAWTKEGRVDDHCRSCRIASDEGRLEERLARLAALEEERKRGKS